MTRRSFFAYCAAAVGAMLVPAAQVFGLLNVDGFRIVFARLPIVAVVWIWSERMILVPDPAPMTPQMVEFGDLLQGVLEKFKKPVGASEV